jgi:pimeloyl-ACP methyl ester carboxylesterase
MKSIFIKVSITLIVLYILLCGLVYFIQEKLIFFPEKLDKDFKFNFGQEYQEINFKTPDNLQLNAVLFPAPHSKGLVFYLHGNAGSINSWGGVAKTYTDLNYDVMIMDYRGFGKSDGKINSQAQLFQDVQIAYNEMKSIYDERKIIVLGYSLGSGIAAKIASTNQPKLLILQTPYYSVTDMMRHTYPILPTFILKYKLETNKFLKGCKIPIVLFHGDQDEVIYYNSSVKLKSIIKKTDRLITLHGQGHNGITDNQDYRFALEKILAE